eukprot:Gb_31911 [translate_table: standard]
MALNLRCTSSSLGFCDYALLGKREFKDLDLGFSVGVKIRKNLKCRAVSSSDPLRALGNRTEWQSVCAVLSSQWATKTDDENPASSFVEQFGNVNGKTNLKATHKDLTSLPKSYTTACNVNAQCASLPNTCITKEANCNIGKQNECGSQLPVKSGSEAMRMQSYGHCEYVIQLCNRSAVDLHSQYVVDENLPPSFFNVNTFGYASVECSSPILCVHVMTDSMGIEFMTTFSQMPFGTH